MFKKCPGCDRELDSKAVAAARMYGLNKPICVYCAVKTVAWLKDELLPLLEKALEYLEGDVHE